MKAFSSLERTFWESSTIRSLPSFFPPFFSFLFFFKWRSALDYYLSNRLTTSPHMALKNHLTPFSQVLRTNKKYMFCNMPALNALTCCLVLDKLCLHFTFRKTFYCYFNYFLSNGHFSDLGSFRSKNLFTNLTLSDFSLT